jgi:hypothetical protein
VTCHDCRPLLYCDGCLAETKRGAIGVARVLGQEWAEQWCRSGRTREELAIADDACARHRLRGAFKGDDRAWDIAAVEAFCNAASEWWETRPERYR